MIIFWHRKDLRISDNSGLNAAIKLSGKLNQKVISIFCLDDNILLGKNISRYRLQFLFESLEDLAENYKRLGSDLLIIRGNAADAIEQIDQQEQISSVYFNRDYSDYASKRDQNLSEKIHKLGIKTTSCKDQVVFEGNEILKADNTPYKVFTPYKTKWLMEYNNLFRENDFVNGILPQSFLSYRDISQLKIQLKGKLRFIRANNLESEYEIKGSRNIYFKGGEESARQRLNDFCNNKKEYSIWNYKEYRDRTDVDGTSRLSAHLKFGTLSIRSVLQTIDALDTNESIMKLREELIWREFYLQILTNFPEVEYLEFNTKYREFPWDYSDVGKNRFEKWCKGETGIPFIDACMRQLNATGWMHNRGRMAVAMFLTKNLLIDWRWGEKYFQSMLIDYDKASNNGGWQWSASTGTDAVPYFRIFNPISQGEKCDPEGKFTRKWVPELKNVESKDIHDPKKLTKYNLIDYLNPIVDLKTSREKALKIFAGI